MAKRLETTKLGRPREFDPTKALDSAMRVFWDKGYEGASISSLTAAMRINRSSMWGTYGDKEELFRKAFERYAGVYQTHLLEALEKPTIREVIEATLRGTVDFLSDPGNPKGCLSVHGALAVSDDADPIKEWLIEYRKNVEMKMRRRFEEAKQAEELSNDTDAAAMSRYVTTLMQGLCVQAASGATKPELTKIIDLALQGLNLSSFVLGPNIA